MGEGLLHEVIIAEGSYQLSAISYQLSALTPRHIAGNRLLKAES
jgi:hypothetical protein